MPATKKKIHKNTGSPKKSQTRSNNSLVLPDFAWDKSTLSILIGIVVAIIVVITFIHFGKAIGDKRRFNWAEQRLGYVKSHLSKVTGLAVTTTWNNSCNRNTEQLFNKSQSCTTELDATYMVTSSAQALNIEGYINKLMNSPQVFGNVFSLVNDSGGNNVPSKGLYCDWINGFEPTPSSVQDGVKTQISFSTSCSAGAAISIYPGP